MSRRTPRVLHLINWLTTGGIERWLLQMIQTVDRDRYAMDVCCKGASVGALAPIAEAAGARIWHIPFDATHVRYAYRLQSLIQQQGYDIVHNHLAVYAGMPTMVARRLHKPTVVSFHNTSHASDVLSNPLLRLARDGYGHLSIKLATQLADVVTGCSQDVVDSHMRQYGIDPAKTRVLYYGVDMSPRMEQEQRAAVRREIDVPEDAPMIVHIGRFAEQKNHFGLLEIAKKLRASHPAAVFVLVGDGKLRSAVEEKVAQEGLQSMVRFLGIRNDVDRILGASDMLLLPSFWEGFGMVAIEANAASIPVVASDVDGLREAVIHGKTGFLLPVESTDAFVDTIRVLVENADLRRELGQNGRQHVEKTFSRFVSADNLCQLYDRCLEGSPLRHPGVHRVGNV
jgi:glycosyltransferase involved in cell wall biosynthesis